MDPTWARLGLLAGSLMLVLVAVGGAPSSANDSGPAPPSPAANPVTLNTTPPGLLLELNGTPVQAPYTFSCDPGTFRTVNAPSPQVIGATRYVFVAWSDGDNRSHTISCDTPTNYTASFAREYRLAIDSFPTGRQVVVDGIPYTTPAVVWCPEAFVRFVNMFPQEIGGVRYTPMNWSDGGATNHTVSCDAPRTLLASFLTEYAIGLFSSLGESFTILVDGIAYGTPAVYWCGERSEHVLDVPSPQRNPFTEDEYRFIGWSDFGPPVRRIVCDGPMNYTAIFERVAPPPPPPPPFFSGSVLLLIVLGIVGLTVLIPFLVLRWVDRRRPTPAAPSLRAGGCLRCGSRAEPDWTYCMACGGQL